MCCCGCVAVALPVRRRLRLAERDQRRLRSASAGARRRRRGGSGRRRGLCRPTATGSRRRRRPTRPAAETAATGPARLGLLHCRAVGPAPSAGTTGGRGRFLTAAHPTFFGGEVNPVFTADAPVLNRISGAGVRALSDLLRHGRHAAARRASTAGKTTSSAQRRALALMAEVGRRRSRGFVILFAPPKRRPVARRPRFATSGAHGANTWADATRPACDTGRARGTGRRRRPSSLRTPWAQLRGGRPLVAITAGCRRTVRPALSSKVLLRSCGDDGSVIAIQCHCGQPDFPAPTIGWVPRSGRSVTRRLLVGAAFCALAIYVRAPPTPSGPCPRPPSRSSAGLRTPLRPSR